MNAVAKDDRIPDLNASDIPLFAIPRVDEPPRGLDAVMTVVDRIHATHSVRRAASRARRTTRTTQSGEPQLAQLVRTLTIVAGKGGVGKSTIATAIAIAAADAGEGTVLLVSTDPAPSIADALGASDAPWARGDIEAPIGEAPGLVVRQMDASAAFTQLRSTYQSRIDGLFDSLVSRGVDVEHDRAILRELLALAPPGVDEIFALSALGDALAEQRFARIIVDPAPTGHLLRLLDMPAIALDWTHRLMRLMLKYQNVVSLGDTARDLLDFAKRTRQLQALLHDRARCAVIVVALDEPIVRDEAARLIEALVERGIEVGALVWNRVSRSPTPLPVARNARHFCADEVQPPPIGVPALRAWSRSWRMLAPNS
jgi:arsenite-transporting ATPase